MFQGMLPAIVTPFQDAPAGHPALDLESLERLIEWELGCGANGLVVVGSTGEAATLSYEEKCTIIERSVAIVAKRVPVIAGTGTNCTRDSVEMSKRAKALGADGVLLVAPYYNKPTQEGLFQHFRTIAVEAKVPSIVYNIPGRSAVEISASTFRKLGEVTEIVGVKQSVDSASKLVELADALPPRVALLAGDDPITYATMSVGGKGVISATGTAFPREMIAIVEPALRGDMKASLEAQKKAMAVINAMFVETNPIPAKAALKLMGIITSDALRLPLTGASEKTKEELKRLVGTKA